MTRLAGGMLLPSGSVMVTGHASACHLRHFGMPLVVERHGQVYVFQCVQNNHIRTLISRQEDRASPHLIACTGKQQTPVPGRRHITRVATSAVEGGGCFRLCSTVLCGALCVQARGLFSRAGRSDNDDHKTSDYVQPLKHLAPVFVEGTDHNQVKQTAKQEPDTCADRRLPRCVLRGKARSSATSEATPERVCAVMPLSPFLAD
jgi:hypothetical protein